MYTYESTRNLTLFRRHLSPASLHDDFAADFGFRNDGSRFSVLHEHEGLPGPDAVFTHIQTDARQLFDKLLGLNITYPDAEAGGPLFPYRTANHYRSHIQEFFHWSGQQHRPSPPVEGECVLFYEGFDALVIRYRLRNRSKAAVPLVMTFESHLTEGEEPYRKVSRQGFDVGLTQKVSSPYVSRMALTCEQPVRFAWDGQAFKTKPIRVKLAPEEEREWVFRARFDLNKKPSLPTGPYRKSESLLKAAIGRTNRFLTALPVLEKEERRFETVMLRAAGILQTNRYYQTDLKGRRMMTIHAGKTGVEATWWWDGAIHLLGLGLCGDRETVRGAVHLLLGGLDKDGKPPVRYQDQTYAQGVQMPILAWGVVQADSACADPVLRRRAYPGLSRYVRWWLSQRNERGLISLPNRGTAQDDSPRWTERFSSDWAKGEPWHKCDWGHSRPADFESPDVNAHLYLELRAMARLAALLNRAEDAKAWELEAGKLGKAINRWLFDPRLGIYQDRHQPSGRFTDYITSGCFLPLYAGLAKTSDAQKACRRYLLDPQRFYTCLPFAGVDRSHPAFINGGTLYEVPRYPGARLQSAYWLGRVWLQYSYWLTGALWQSGLHREADEAADKILTALSRQESLYECYDPLTGTGNGHPEFSWGAAPVLGLVSRFYRKGYCC